MKNNFKTSKCAIIAILTFCLLLCISGTQVFAAIVEATEDTPAAIEDTTQELMPRSANGDQYADQHFRTLADAQKAYGYGFTYTACEPFYNPPGCYGGYWSNGGIYNYYYTFDDGYRCYIHVGV